MKIIYLLLGALLLQGCGGAVYRTQWADSSGLLVSAGTALVDCELKAVRQKAEWIKGNPIPAHPGKTNTVRKLAQQQAHYKATAAANDFHKRALNSCMTTAGFTQKRVCVERCN